jgi:hypothetical protein
MGVPRKERLFFLCNKDNQTLSLEGDAIVTNEKPKPLPESPDGWQSVEISFGTNNKYWSLNRSFTVPLKFVGDGAEILRYFIYKGKGYEEEISVTILRLNTQFEDGGKEGRYELEYKGKIDFVKMKNDPATGVTVNTIEGGLLSFLNANDSINYEIPCNATNQDCIRVKFDGTDLFDGFTYSTLALDDIDVYSVLYHPQTLHAVQTPYILVPFTYLNNEGDSVGISHGDQSFDTPFSDVNTLISSANTGFENLSTKDVKIHIENTLHVGIKIRDLDTSPITGPLKASFFVSDGTVLTETVISEFDVNVNQTYPINLDHDLTIPPNGKLFLVLRLPTELQNVIVTDAFPDRQIHYLVSFKEEKFKISFSSKNPVSYCYALRPLALGKQLVNKMTNGRYTMESNFFTIHNNIVAAGGEAIRELPNAVLKTSFQDYFNSYNSLFNLGAQVINDVLWIEPKADLYNDAGEIFDLGEVSDFAIGYAEEYLVNSVKIGYPAQDYDERNGRYEFNDTIQEKLPVTAVNKELDLVSKYRGDSYGIEFNRGKLNNKDTTDNKGDNEVFIINVDTTITSGTATVTATKTATTQVFGNISFDTVSYDGGAEGLLQADTLKDSFAYINSTPQKANVSFTLTGTNTTEEPVTFIFYAGGQIVGTQTIEIFRTSFQVVFDYEVTLSQTETVTVYVDGAVGIESAGITFKFLDQIAVPTYTVKRVKYDLLTGVPTDTVYNVEEMTPKRMLLAHGNYLRSLLFQLPGEKITFQTADKNKDLSTTYQGVTITEKEDVVAGTFADPLFLPFEISFTTRVPYSFAKIMSKLSVGHIKMTYNYFPIYLLPIGDMKAKPVSEEAQEWKLLASPVNSLDTLIKLSQGAVIISDYMQNQLIISDLNPVHFVRYDCTPTADKTLTIPALPPTGNQALVAGVRSSSWNSNGARIYAPGFPLNGLGTVVAHLTTPHFWVNGEESVEVVNGSPTSNTDDSRMNANGIWVSNNTAPNTVWLPVDEWIGFSRKITVSFAKKIYLGISGDNWVRLKVNGVEILNTTGSDVHLPSSGVNFLTWSIYPINLKSGDNYVEMSVMNTTTSFASNPAGFACEIYDNTLLQIQAATQPSDLNIVFKTADMVGQAFDIGTTIGYSCQDGWVLQKDTSGSYTCVKTIAGNNCSDRRDLNKKYHFKGIYDDRFTARQERYSDKATYYQKWQTNDVINLQFITVGYGGLELQIFDCKTNQIAVVSSKVVPDTSLQAPYVKQQFSIDLSDYNEGVYQFVLAVNGTFIAISEWQNFVNDLPDTLLIEYYHTTNKPDAYFKEWRPNIRVEGFMTPLVPESSSTTYEDEPGDTEILSGTSWMRQKVLLGDGYGMPDYMAKKLNRILLLNRVFIEGIEYTKVGDAKLAPSEEITGYPMVYYTVDMRESQNTMGLVISDMDLGNEFVSTVTLDAEAFGGAEGVIQIDIN